MSEELTSNIDIDLYEMSKDDLIALIMFAHKNDYTFNQAFVAALEGAVKQIESTENS
jgi:hypothetical protein